MRFLQQNQNAPVEFAPPVRPASATLAFVSPAGVTLSSPSVVLDPVSRAIASVGDFSFTTGAGVGVVVPGRPYWLVNPNEGAALVRPSSVSGTTVSYQDTLGVSVTTACLLYGATLSATIPSSATAQVGQWYQLRWLVTPAGAGQVSSYLEPASVCRTVFLEPVTPAIAARHAGYAFPSVAAGKRADYWAGVADRASRRVIQRVLASGRMPYLVGDQSLLADAGMAALRIELARDGLIPPGFDGTTFVDRMEEELKQQLEYALAGAMYDQTDDGKVEPADLRSPKTIRLCRT
jgi:glutathione S-transferase